MKIYKKNNKKKPKKKPERYKCLGNTIDGNIFNKHNDQKKKTLVKRIFFTCMKFIQFKLLCFNLILQFWRWKEFPLCLCTLWIYRMTSLVSCCARIVNQKKGPTLLHDRADVTSRYKHWINLIKKNNVDI